MRIALILPGYSSDYEDWGIPVFRNLADALALQHDVHVYALYYPPRAASYMVGNVMVSSFGNGNARGIHTATRWREVIQMLVQEGRRQRWDVLHAFFADQTGVCAVIAGWLLQVPVILSFAGSEPVALPSIHYGEQLWWWHRWMVRFATLGATRIAVGSHYLFRLAQACLAARDADKLEWAPLGVDTVRFCPIAKPKPCHRILHVASRRPIKNPELLLHVFQQVMRQCPDAELEIVGGGWYDAFKEMNIQVASRVRLRGELSHSELPAVYASAALYLQTSLHEAQGIAVLEAAACGVPTVGTPVGVVAELSPHAAQCGDTVTQLAQIVLDLLAHPNEATRLGDAAYGRVCADYSLEASVRRFGQIYERC